jgi:hypothetical protein
LKIEEKKRINEHREIEKEKGKKKKIPQRVQGLVVFFFFLSKWG